MRKPTPEDIDLLQHSEGHGFTKKKLKEWGVSWPPPTGWRQKLLAELGLKFLGPRNRTNFKLVEVAPEHQPIVDKIGSEEWKRLSYASQQAVLKFLNHSNH